MPDEMQFLQEKKPIPCMRLRDYNACMKDIISYDIWNAENMKCLQGD